MRDSNCGALGDVPFHCVGGVFCIAAVFWSSHVSRKVIVWSLRLLDKHEILRRAAHLLDLIGNEVFNITVRVFHAVQTVVAQLSLFYLLNFSIVDDSVEHPLNGGPAQRVGDFVFLGKIDQLLIAKR